MRYHECLDFIDQLTVWLKREPTREELSVNFHANAQRFAGSGSDMRAILRDFKLKKIIKERRCSEACHARHIHITAHGRALLDSWNENGCESERRTDERCTMRDFGFKEQHIHL